MASNISTVECMNLVVNRGLGDSLIHIQLLLRDNHSHI